MSCAGGVFRHYNLRSAFFYWKSLWQLDKSLYRKVIYGCKYRSELQVRRRAWIFMHQCWQTLINSANKLSERSLHPKVPELKWIKFLPDWLCKKCFESHMERDVAKVLNENNIKFEQEKTFDWLKYENNLYLD